MCPTYLDGLEQYELGVAIGQVQSHAALHVDLVPLERAVRLGDHRLQLLGRRERLLT